MSDPVLVTVVESAPLTVSMDQPAQVTVTMAARGPTGPQGPPGTIGIELVANICPGAQDNSDLQAGSLGRRAGNFDIKTGWLFVFQVSIGRIVPIATHDDHILRQRGRDR